MSLKITARLKGGSGGGRQNRYVAKDDDEEYYDDGEGSYYNNGGEEADDSWLFGEPAEAARPAPRKGRTRAHGKVAVAIPVRRCKLTPP